MSTLLELERGGVHLPGNALCLSSRLVGEKTVLTFSESFVQPGGGSRFSAAQADTVTISEDTLKACWKRTRCQCFAASQKSNFGLSHGDSARSFIEKFCWVVTTMFALEPPSGFYAQSFCYKAR